MKNRLTSTMAAALLASAGLSAPALAQQDKAASPANADKTQVVPGKQDLKPYPATVEKMDNNAQRQHDRDGGVASQGKATNARAAGNAGQQTRLPPGEVRDWAAIDKNKDNLISPDEMEAALMQSRSSATTTTR